MLGNFSYARKVCFRRAPGVAVDNVGVDVEIKFGDSRSNSYRDIRGADFVSNERTKTPNSAKRNRVSPKKC